MTAIDQTRGMWRSHLPHSPSLSFVTVIIVFREVEYGIEIVRLLHERMLPSREL